MSNEMALSRFAAIVQLKRAGLTEEQALEAIETARVAARWNDGLGRVAYYYPRDVESARVSYLAKFGE
jgi:hypothetical protein